MSDKAENHKNQFLKTDGGKTKSNAIEVPSIALPKGGGAMKGIDEKFSVNAVNGTASFSFPLPVSQARGVTPNLSLSYNSGSGNGIFGLGWNLSLPSIKRKTDKGLPQYFDAIDSDTFLFSEAEDLVAEFEKNTNGTFKTDTNGDYIIHEKNSADGLFTIRFYRPRTEGLFARIERWTKKDGTEVKWRVMTKDNITTLFGWSTDSRIADPADAKRIFEWLPEFVFDDKGNCCKYHYQAEDATGFDGALPHNRNRKKNGNLTYTNRYLKYVLYGNRIPYPSFGAPYPADTDFLFETVFDYGTLSGSDTVDTLNTWDFRADAFSDYKAGFEIRTTRLCKRVLLFHHFNTNEYDGLVKSLNFDYDTSTEQDFTFLKAGTVHGYIKKSDGSYSQKQLPAIEFTYQAHDWNKTVKTISRDALVHAPTGIDEPPYQFVDLYNEGLSGILSEQAAGWFYKHNLGDGNFAQAKMVTPKPSFMGLGNVMQLSDLDADGGKQLVSYHTEPKGFFELNDDNNWQPLRNFKQLPNIDFNDPYTRMLDLNGDGKAELVITEDNVFTWYESLGRAGFKAARKTPKPFDEEAGPALVFADAKQSIFVADMSGDGLSDLVRIRNKEVCYWPNLGYGKFGTKVALDNSPVFDTYDGFNPAYIKLADIDGSGTTDIIYLGKNKFSCWKNLSGNRLSATPFEIDGFPEIHNSAKVTVTDLLGNGVACIVWSSPLPKDATAPLKYIDLMNSKKPHLMVAYKNNMGKEVALEYTPSTKFYLADKLAGKPWVTKLHFPVHCISKTTVEDKITGHKFTSEYKYHHGYYDHPEREFRGFGMVEQTDGETFEHWAADNTATNVVDKTLHQEPVVSKQWVHTGAYLRNGKILNQFAQEYWYEEMKRQGYTVANHEQALPDAIIIPGTGVLQTAVDNMTPEEKQQALRACKGMALRSEVFAYDAPETGATADQLQAQITPYTVATHNCVIELLQPKGKNKYAVFAVKESEAITYSYERKTADPRIAHTLNIKLDEYGNVLEAASVVYPRLTADTSLPSATQAEQSKTYISYIQNSFTNGFTDDVAKPDVHRLPLPAETKTYELKGVVKAGSYYTIADFANVFDANKADEAEYNEQSKALTHVLAVGSTPAFDKIQRRLIEHVQSLYYQDDLTTVLGLGLIDTLAIPYENYQLAYTTALLNDIYGTLSITNTLLGTEGKFMPTDSHTKWWIRSGTTQFFGSGESATEAKARFYMPISYTEPFGGITQVTYYGSYYMMIETTQDALGNQSSVSTFNFRTLAAQRLKDINGNYSEAIADELGLVKALAVFGKGSEADDLTGLHEYTDTTESGNIYDFLNVAPILVPISTSPLVNAKVTDYVTLTTKANTLLQHATTRFVYDFDRYKNTGKPAVVSSIVREQHYQLNNNSPLQISFEYSDGMGRVAMKKVQAEGGDAKYVALVTDTAIKVGTIDTSGLSTPQLRWIGNGKTIVNNKGNVVKQYEPYFSVTNGYEDFKELVESGVTPVLYYDAAGRLIRTDMPDGTYSRVEFDSWKQLVYDANDTVLDSEWYLKRTVSTHAGYISDAKEQAAAAKAAAHANTPNVLHFDTLGRPVLSLDYYDDITTQPSHCYATQIALDIESNLHTVTDARNNPVMQYKYDMLGHLVYQKSMDAGQRWLLTNVVSNPLRTWDERSHEFQYFYDVAHRPTTSVVIGGDGATPLNNIFSKIIYGESLLTTGRTNESTLQADNILGKPIETYDSSGFKHINSYDFKGNPISVNAQLLLDATITDVDWNNNPSISSEVFTTSSLHDALNRVTTATDAGGNITQHIFNESGLLKTVALKKNGAFAFSNYVNDIHYDALSRREAIWYGNGTKTGYTYDALNHKVRRILTVNVDSLSSHYNEQLQDLNYYYDAVGNITTITDAAQQTLFYSGTIISPDQEFTYDALYRLIEAKGREKMGISSMGSNDNYNDATWMSGTITNNSSAVQRYTQSYQYDGVGNILELQHNIGSGSPYNFTRDYNYNTANNQLQGTTVGGSPTNTYGYTYNAHGSLLSMPHLTSINWNTNEQMSELDLGGGGTAYYQYDSSGNRVRKYVVKNNVTEERIYLGSFEIYRKTSNGTLDVERTTTHIADDTGRIAMLEVLTQGSDGSAAELKRFIYSNHLGSASLELDDSGNIISYEEYHPFGTTSYQASNSSINATAKRYRYTGKERDDESGFYYHGARYYIPWLCRWTAADPIGIGDGVNLYAYCGNNPVMKHDPSGNTGEQTGRTRYCALMDDFNTGNSQPTKAAKPAHAKPNSQPQSNTQSAGAAAKPSSPSPAQVQPSPAKSDENVVSNAIGKAYVPEFATFKMTGGVIDYFAAVDNAAISIVNLVPQLWNSTVANAQSLSKGTWLHDIGNELKQDGVAIKNFAVQQKDYTLHTPILQQFKETAKFAVSPQALQIVATIVIAKKLPIIAENAGKAVSSISTTTTDGYLFKGFNVKAPFDIPVQRFGNMNTTRPDFWGLKIGSNSFANRTFAAIKPEWNSLNQYTSGVISKGTPMKFGIIGPQGLRFPGGSLQFIVDSKNVINQSSKLINR